MSEIPFAQEMLTKPSAGRLQGVRRVIASVCLDIGHRIGSLALLLLLASVAVRLAGADVRLVLGITFAAADVAFVCSFVAWQLSMDIKRQMREALGVGIFNLVLVLASITYMILTDMGKQ